jgi:hypothetical protein
MKPAVGERIRLDVNVEVISSQMLCLCIKLHSVVRLLGLRVGIEDKDVLMQFLWINLGY